jgi:uncharacterized protein (TIGR00661 family)
MSGNFNIPRKVLIAPLDWGLGHATRCIPVIQSFLELGSEVVLAASGPQAQILKQQFPQLTLLPLPGYAVRYSKKGATLALRLLLQAPRILKTIRAEYLWLKQVQKTHQFNLIISDNRFGLWHRSVPSIFITHQLQIQVPNSWLEKKIQRINYKYIQHFQQCWIPDGAELSLAGHLSHPQQLPNIPVQYMGPISRMRKLDSALQYKYCFLLSGPEPQRSILEKQILAQVDQLDAPCLLIRGLPGAQQSLPNTKHCTIVQHAGTDELMQLLTSSEYIVCRSGYTSLMELMAMQRKMILIPTPGQTEQQYLASYFMDRGWGLAATQENLDLLETLQAAAQFDYHFPTLQYFHTARLQELLSAISWHRH